jgi:hypothetical protein
MEETSPRAAPWLPPLSVCVLNETSPATGSERYKHRHRNDARGVRAGDLRANDDDPIRRFVGFWRHRLLDGRCLHDLLVAGSAARVETHGLFAADRSRLQRDDPVAIMRNNQSGIPDQQVERRAGIHLPRDRGCAHIAQLVSRRDNLQPALLAKLRNGFHSLTCGQVKDAHLRYGRRNDRRVHPEAEDGGAAKLVDAHADLPLRSDRCPLERRAEPLKRPA